MKLYTRLKTLRCYSSSLLRFVFYLFGFGISKNAGSNYIFCTNLYMPINFG